MLGGKVILKSEENKGSVFTIELPLKIYKEDNRNIRNMEISNIYDSST